MFVNPSQYKKMKNISLFTAVKYEEPKTFGQYLANGIEDYFNLSGRCACVIDQQVIIKRQKQNVVLTVIKIVSYMTVVIPLIMLIAKIAFRATHKFHIATNKVFKLMTQFTKAWNGKDFDLNLTDFDLNRFTKDLLNHVARFKKADITNGKHFGFIDKFDLNDNSQIYIRADLHGDLKSLIENIRTIQEQGLLDGNFKCKPGIHLIFLGDYCDRGNYGTQILELLMHLREENPEQVHFIRGNHEYVSVNKAYGGTDPCLMKIVNDGEASKALELFYETMSLTTYFSVNQQGKREYIQCTHGLFEPSMDPAKLLDDAKSKAYIPVPTRRKLNSRVCKIAAFEDSKLSVAAKRIATIVKNSRKVESNHTAYNWGDVSAFRTTTESLGNRKYALCTRDIKHYLDLSSQHHKVVMIFRGHQHAFQQLALDGKVIVTTLPVGMDNPHYQMKYFQPDRAYILRTSVLVENWTKRAILREKGRAVTDMITLEVALTSNSI